MADALASPGALADIAPTNNTRGGEMTGRFTPIAALLIAIAVGVAAWGVAKLFGRKRRDADPVTRIDPVGPATRIDPAAASDIGVHRS